MPNINEFLGKPEKVFKNELEKWVAQSHVVNVTRTRKNIFGIQ